jgi:transcriptional activator of cad operon
VEFRSPMVVTDNRELRIGAWRVDPALDEISTDGTTVKLEPRAMRVLVCLAEHAGQVVSVDQLLDAVWKDVVVTPDSVYQAVAGLRRALGDDAKEPAYIANVLRRGYRLVAPVARVDSSGSRMDGPAAEAAPIPVSATTPASPQSRVWPWAVLVLAARRHRVHWDRDLLRNTLHAWRHEQPTETVITRRQVL